MLTTPTRPDMFNQPRNAEENHDDHVTAVFIPSVSCFQGVTYGPVSHHDNSHSRHSG